MSEIRDVEKLSYYTTSIGLIYTVIGLLSGFGLVYILMSGGQYTENDRFSIQLLFCMNILILIRPLDERLGKRN